MAYAKDGYPVEGASKIGHIKLIQNADIQRLLSQFEAVSPGELTGVGFVSGHIDTEQPADIEYVVTIDGGQAIVPNQIRREKCMAYLQVCAVVLKMADLRRMRDDPMLDPREVATLFNKAAWYNPAALPLCGVRLPGESVKITIRKIVDATLHSLGLYPTLQFLTSREWDPKYQMPGEDSPRFSCWQCNEEIILPRSSIHFTCPSCGHHHTLSDYLDIGASSSDSWSREDSANALRDVLETLALFHFLRQWRNQPKTLAKVLFIKDGPLLLRAALSRLVEPIRAYVEFLKDQKISINVVGVEKNGDLVSHLKEIESTLKLVGDFFLPSVKYLVEEVSGQKMAPDYRNRVQYGAKVVARVGPHHTLALNVPTGNFQVEPKESDLIGFASIMRTLKELVSYRYENALMPVVVANSLASIAQRPSGEILQQFTEKFLGQF